MDYDYDADEPHKPEAEYFYSEENYEEWESPLKLAQYQFMQSCAIQNLVQLFQHLHLLFLWIFVFRISHNVPYVPNWLKHIFSFLCGVLALQSIFHSSWYLLFIIPVVSYFILLLPNRRGEWILLISACFLVYCEIFWMDPRDWHAIRGVHMIVTMKIVSLAFDLDLGTVYNVPGVIQFAGYIFCPGTCVFGPWTSFLDYMKIFELNPKILPRYRFHLIGSTLSSAFIAIAFLVLSTCVAGVLLQDIDWRWIEAYRDAFSFRCSHYFVSYLSQTTLLLSGFSKLGQSDEIVTTRPLQIELPRSLIQVVVSWNVPMHSWLKIYVFNTTRQFGNFLAIISTYAASALLHGLNFQLAAVLLSLGVYSYIEFMLRRKLSTIFSACVQARPCKSSCSHRYQWNHPGTIVANLFLALLTVLHLAYLGVMFDNNDESELGYSFSHTMTKWANLNYASHFIVASCYALYFFISLYRMAFDQFGA